MNWFHPQVMKSLALSKSAPNCKTPPHLHQRISLHLAAVERLLEGHAQILKPLAGGVDIGNVEAEVAVPLGLRVSVVDLEIVLRLRALMLIRGVVGDMIAEQGRLRPCLPQIISYQQHYLPTAQA